MNLTISSLLDTSPETVQSIRKYFDLDKPGKMDEAVAIFEDWIKRQNHFRKKDFNRHFLEMMIIQSKGSLERAKARLDKYCTLKTMLPKYFEKADPKTDFPSVYQLFTCGVLPKFVGDHFRVCLLKGYSENITPSSVLEFYRYTSMMVEYILSEDYFNGLIMVYDFMDVNMTNFITAMDPVEISEALKLYTECFGLRVKGLHYVTPSKMIHVLVNLLRKVFSHKLVERIHVYKDMDALFKVIPREIFPKDYGGMEKSIKAIGDDWIQILASEKSMNYIQEMRRATIDEDLRDKNEFNSKYMGLPGTFRSLSVD